MSNKRFLIIIAIATFLLVLPFVAMQFTNEVSWEISDFIVMGILLFGASFLIELTMRKIKSFKSRVLLCALIVFVLFLIWVELAVGIFGSPFAGT